MAVPRSVSRAPAAPGVSQSARSAESESPTGYAELFLSLWLRADVQRSDSAAVKLLREMAPEVGLPSWGQEPPMVDRLVAVRRRPDGGSGWLVTVAAQLHSSKEQASVRYFEVPVLVSGGGPAQQVVVPRAPSEVGAPSRVKVPPSVYSGEVPVSSSLAQAVGDFLTAYLGGGPGVSDRFLAPGVRLPAVVPAPYRTVVLERVAAAPGVGEGAVGRDGSVARVLAQVTARDGAGRQWPLAYALRLVARAGRWEVTGLDSALDSSSRGSVTGASALGSGHVLLGLEAGR
ncbi:conjugal transfer protein [Streptomyces sp. ET3-23]|uniref:conjugal transfer protein n=1 Tax=Streptomyces sp. ET3-23 TaxID=2885643 RepID=UPI001D0FC6A1|nr:conjugal transfer protein [Streptomyces sp. ET3-23]MCC2280566.1 conjugal transfer protein [Streptomyces sp. ET3-23]